MLAAANLPERHRVKQISRGRLEWGNTCSKVIDRLNKGSVMALVGGNGTGKTQIGVEAVRHVCCQECKGGLYTRAAEIFLAVRECYRKEAVNTEAKTIERYCRPYLLVIDECGDRANSDAENRLLRLIVDRRYAACKPTILIANGDQHEFRQHMGDSIFDRLFESGGWLPCNWASFRVEGRAQNERTPTGSDRHTTAEGK